MTAETVRSISAEDHRLEHIVRDRDARPQSGQAETSNSAMTAIFKVIAIRQAERPQGPE